MSAGAGPLAGVRVVELGVWVAGPAPSGGIGGRGAAEVKVEQPAGEPKRGGFGALGVADQQGVPPVEIDNRGKRSVVLDLQTDEGRRRMEQLLVDADVFVTNVRPEALGRRGLAHDEVLVRHPRLVYASLTGYGLAGPDVNRAGYDIGAFWARSGVAHTFVPPDQLPPALRSGMGDHITGMALLSGITAKLFERERTGRGGLVATSLLRTGMYTLGWDIGVALRYGKRESTRPRERNRAPLMNCYRAGDGRAFWLLLLEADRHWPKLLAALGRPELGEDERFVDARSRNLHAEALIATLDEEFARFDSAELTSRFDAHDVWWAPINSIFDVIDDPQAQAAGAFVDMAPQPGEGPYRAVNGPVDFDGRAVEPGPVPRRGEHTAEVLTELDRRWGGSEPA